MPEPLFTRTPESVHPGPQATPYPVELYPGCPCYACDSPTWPTHPMLGRLRCRMSLCPACGNKRCPGAANHDNECSGSNQPGQAGSLYGDAALLAVAEARVAADTGERHNLDDVAREFGVDLTDPAVHPEVER